MAPSCRHPIFTVAIIVTVAFVFFLTVQPLKSGGVVLSLQESKKVIGSRPPVCVNKCKKCRPCMATLVVPHHQRNNKGFSFQVVPPGDDDPYYLLSWKCKCGNKLFQP